MNTPQEFAPLLAGLRTLPSASGAALATLTRTSGSTFRRAGARMLVYGDGRVVRGLSAGCPEQDIVARAREAIAADAARVVRYDREQGFDTLLEMGCGGELEVLIEPLRTAADCRFAEVIDTCLQARRCGVLATIFSLDGTCLPRPRRWIGSQELLFDELQDPELSQQVGELAASLTARDKPTTRSFVTKHGRVEALIEHLQPVCAALLFGVNASALALARTLAQLGWTVTLIDHRAERPPNESLPDGVRWLQCPAGQVATALQFDHRTFAVVMTHNLERDIEYVHALRTAPLAYLGAIGARRRAASMFEATGLRAPQLRAPAGLDIGSETPEEIALAIAAEMLAVANDTSGGALSATREPIHR
ncbi:MAG: XdhC family protein [Panacagrimonas sp.]